jgi:DNA-binding protein HU-beta
MLFLGNTQQRLIFLFNSIVPNIFLNFTLHNILAFHDFITYFCVVIKSYYQLILNTMNKAELIGAIASEAKITKAFAKKALEAFVKATTTALKKGDRVALLGFGTFHVAKRAARTGRNPRTGKTIKIPAKKVAHFRAGSDLKKTVK